MKLKGSGGLLVQLGAIRKKIFINPIAQYRRDRKALPEQEGAPAKKAFDNRFLFEQRERLFPNGGTRKG